MADSQEQQSSLPADEVRETRAAIESAAQTLQDTSKQMSSTQWMIKLTPLVFFLLLLAVVSRWGGTENETLLQQLANKETARGLITLLFSVGTIWIFMQLASYAISNSSTDDRFGRGKEVLIALVGIFGAIIGYYFGVDTADKINKAETEAAQNVNDEITALKEQLATLQKPQPEQADIESPPETASPVPLPDPVPGAVDVR